MLDHGFIPRTTASQTQLFTSSAYASATNEWQTWIRPRNIGIVNFRLMGSGNGGGGGMTGAAGTARGGGGGGGSGAIVDLLIMASLLPDVLYVFAPRGGSGGAAATIGTVGNHSYVSLSPNNTTAAACIGISGAGVGTAGGAGTAGAGGAAGNAHTVAVTTTCHGHGLGQFSARVGQVGGAGGAQTGAVGASITWGGGGIPLSGGAGGGGTPTGNTNFAGGSQQGGGLMPTLGPTTVAGEAGPHGIILSGNPMWGTNGGCGGHTNGAAGTGGRGGNGAWGSGGAGGGGAVTGGAGGDGGPGAVWITCY